MADAKSEKMTDEELERTLGQIQLGEGAEPVSLLRRHIAALEAARDALQAQTQTDHRALELGETADTRLEQIFGWMARRGGPGFADEIRAHIATLAAERDSYERCAQLRQQAISSTAEQLNDVTRDRGALLWQRGALAANVAEARAERDSLRRQLGQETEEDRALNEIAGILGHGAAGKGLANHTEVVSGVRTLKAERDAFRQTNAQQVARVQALEADLAAQTNVAIRESTEASVARIRAQEAEHRLAAIRQRAGDDDRLAEVLEENVGKGGNAGLRAVARFIVGENAPETMEDASTSTSEPVCSAHPDQKCDPETPGVFECRVDTPALPAVEARKPSDVDSMTDEDARRICASAGVDVGAGLAGAMALVRGAQRPEPTTAEAFAAVREALRDLYGYGHRHEAANGSAAQDRAEQRIALLERRVAAMVRAINAMIALRDEEGPIPSGHHDAAMTSLRAALTDAPPVFTLKEVNDLVGKAVDATRDTILAALRK